MSANVATLNPAEIAMQPKWMVWTGWVLSALPVLGMLMSGAMKLSGAQAVTDGFVGKFGYPASVIVAIGLVELTCVALYVIPQTAIFGAILMTGYLGGAVATHVRVSDVFVAPLLLGVLAWLGLYLREPRLRALVPLRKPALPL